MIQKIPSMGDNELTILYQNCLREITNATPQMASAQLIVDAINDERFLILTDDIAQTWMERKTADPDRWLHGMSRLQKRLEESGDRGADAS